MYSTNDYRYYELYHHGILGQKWGKKNGPPYPLDASDHSAAEKKAGWHKSLDGSSKQSSTKTSSALKAIENGAADFHSPAEKIKAVTADCEFAEIDSKKYRTDPAYKKKVDEVADLGYAAVNKMRGYGDNDESDIKYYMKSEGLSREKAEQKLKQSNREWFLYEDQTIGMPMIAGLVKSGYSADQVGKMIDTVEKNYGYSYEEVERAFSKNSDPGTRRAYVAAFNIENGNWGNELKDFAKACEDELKNR